MRSAHTTGTCWFTYLLPAWAAEALAAVAAALSLPNHRPSSAAVAGQHDKNQVMGVHKQHSRSHIQDTQVIQGLVKAGSACIHASLVLTPTSSGSSHAFLVGSGFILQNLRVAAP